jgi:hypothetical protein
MEKIDKTLMECSNLNITTEKDAAETLKRVFTLQDWEFKEQYETKNNKLIDFVVKARYADGYIFFGVECKRRLTDTISANELADYLEQASAYSRDLNMPVFIGPVMSYKRGHDLCCGGDRFSSISAFNIFGGRLNVGMLVFNPYMSAYRRSRWSMIMRGNEFWNTEKGFNSSRLYMVSSKGSKQERTPLKIWKTQKRNNLQESNHALREQTPPDEARIPTGEEAPSRTRETHGEATRPTCYG